jgi:hypothetical protein
MSHPVGITALTSVATLSLMILPYSKSTVKQTMRTNVQKVSSSVDTAVANNLEKGKQKANERIRESIGPFTRFVKLEKQLVMELSEKFQKLREDVRDINSQIK